MFVILLAGLTAIPPHLYEAAELDGVSAWQAFWSITAAASRADDAARHHLPPARRDQALRHDLHHDRRRAGHADLHRLLLSLHGRLHPVPPVAGDRRQLDLPDPDADRRHASWCAGCSGRRRADGRPHDRQAPRGAPRPPIGRILFLGFFLVFVLAPLYWMFITSIKPSDDYLAVPPVWFPDEPTIVPLHGGALRLSRPGRADQQPHHLDVGDRPLGLVRHADGLQPGALQHRRPASLVLGAVAALPAADRDRPADLPDLPDASA